MIIETILNCKIKMYVKRINTAVTGAAFVELYGMISLSCFLFLGGGVERQRAAVFIGGAEGSRNF